MNQRFVPFVLAFGVLVTMPVIFGTGCRASYPSQREIRTFVDLNRLTRQMEAIRIDCDFARESADAERAKQASADAAAALADLRKAFDAVRAATPFAHARADLDTALRHLAAHYASPLPAADDPVPAAGHAEQFATAYARLVESLNRLAPAPGPKAKARIYEPLPPETEAAIKHATALAELGETQAAVAELDALGEAATTDATRHLCLLLTARWLIGFETSAHLPGGATSPIEQGLERLTRILDSGAYSPALFETFLRWRTATQLYTHGGLRSSPIPNVAYNTRRDAAIHTVMRHLRHHRQDPEAWRQLRALALCPNIWRLREVGNSAFVDERRLDPPLVRQRVVPPTGAGTGPDQTRE